MKKLIKSIFILLLLVIISCASFFMITESARYYMIFYEEGAWQPLYLAALLELFVLVLALIKIGKNKIFHFIQKMIMIGVFSAIIFAAGMQAVNPIITEIAEVSQTENLTQLLQDEYEQLKKDREIFDKQRQKLNTAISSKDRKKIVEDMKELMKQDVKTNTGLVSIINISMLFAIRFLVQIANVFFASMLGVYFRETEIIIEENEVDIIKKLHPTSFCEYNKDHEKYVIYADDKRSRGLGAGKSKHAAWDRAYKNIKKEKDKSI